MYFLLVPAWACHSYIWYPVADILGGTLYSESCSGHLCYGEPLWRPLVFPWVGLTVARSKIMSSSVPTFCPASAPSADLARSHFGHAVQFYSDEVSFFEELKALEIFHSSANDIQERVRQLKGRVFSVCDTSSSGVSVFFPCPPSGTPSGHSVSPAW